MPEIFIDSEAAMEELGARLAAITPPGGTWLLIGELGSGKTTWTRGFVRGLGGDPGQVSSPTYAVLHRYELAKGSIFHLDLYRLGPSGAWNLGLEECVSGSDWLVVEWAGGDGPWASGWVSRLDLACAPDGRSAAWSGSIA